MTETVTVTVFDAARWEGQGWPPDDLAGAIAWMQDKMDSIPEPFRSSAKLEIDVGCQRGSDDDFPKITVTYRRPETAEETAQRIARHAHSVAESEARQRQEYEALKAKPG